MIWFPIAFWCGEGWRNFWKASAFFGIVFFAIQTGARAETGTPTYTRDVMSIIQESCQVCHRPGQIAPMSFMSYEEIRPWAKAIRKVVASRTMPPFHAETSLGEFENDSRLTKAEIAVIVGWVDGGAERGDPEDAPPMKDWLGSKWVIDEPDLVINYPEYVVGGDGKDEYVVFFPDHRFTEDRWVDSIEFRDPDYTSVHHAGIFAVDEAFSVPESKLSVIDAKNFESSRTPFKPTEHILIELLKQKFLYTWTPGFGLFHLSAGEGISIREGESIIIQSHLGPGQESRVVDLSLALKFSDGLITKSSHRMDPLVLKLEIPPGESHYEVRRKRLVKEPIAVYASWTHMHLRGKSNKFVFHYPDGRVDTAFDIRPFSFDWQRLYVLKDPFEVPAGTTIEFVGVWDNSSDNLFNPDPSKTVYWGGSTLDEMYGATLFYSKDLEEPFEVREGIAVVDEVK